MAELYELKERPVTETPLLVFTCTLPDGREERWSSHRVTVGEAVYEPRVLQHNLFEIQTAGDQGVDGIPRISVLLANADSHFSEIERAGGWKGARLAVAFLFYDLRNAEALTEPAVVFQGICNPPDEILELTFRLSATNRMNLQRLLLPQVRIQRRCPWEFPRTAEQRQEAISGGSKGKYSRFYRCGYSAGEDGGTGNLDGDVAFDACGFTRTDCQARGMFAHFGGLEFVPPAIAVRTSGDKAWHTSALQGNAARYNDFVPLVYGTAWYAPPVVFARNDGNLTRMEVLLGLGEFQGVVKVLVNDVEIPQGVAGMNMTGTGWYNALTLGAREGMRNGDFTDGSGNPAGDPYGSMAYLAVAVPNRLNDGSSLPRVKVLVQGLKVPVFDTDGTPGGEQFTNNPAWVLLDVLRRTGWSLAEVDVASFATAAAYCDEGIDAADLYGNAITLPRFGCNLALQTRRSAGDVVRGIRNSSRLLVSYGAGGRLQVRVENSVASELTTKPAWSNAQERISGGWASYEFGDGSDGTGGILRRSSGEPSVRIFSRSMADTPNRLSVEFQDSLNEYQQDSLSLVDVADVERSGQEVAATLAALGLPNADQASRILKVNLDKSARGNTYIEFDTSVKCFGVRPGDLITVTYLKEGFQRQAFRILKIAPGLNHRVTTITAQIHDDAWYEDANGQSTSATGGRREGPTGVGSPRPLLGNLLDEEGNIQFGVAEGANGGSEGPAETSVTVSFVPPAVADGSGPAIPLISLAADVEPGGTLRGGQVLYYAVSARDAAGHESGLSFLVRASVVEDDSAVTLHGLSFAPGTSGFEVYRGSTPAQLYRIATGQNPATEFTDFGADNQLTPPPDANFDHANFYWRIELQPETAVSVHTANTVGNSTLQMAANRYRGCVARITRGRGAGQERPISANTTTQLTIIPKWDVEPDGSSSFCIAESGWKFGALSRTSPVTFAVPNRGGETVHLSGRAANVSDQEAAAELSLVTRWQINGGGASDSDVPPVPFFGLQTGARGGTIELSGVSFATLANTRTVSSATLNLYYWDELQGPSSLALATAIGASESTVDLGITAGIGPGDVLQAGEEIMRVEGLAGGGTALAVTRGAHGSTAASHGAQSPVFRLARLTVIAPFPPDFFGSPYSGSWAYPVTLPDARVASAEFSVTNNRGSSPTAALAVTHSDDLGLRTLSGGQYSLQVPGYLAVDQVATPVLLVEQSHAVRDVYAVLGGAADAAVQVRVNVNDAAYCTLSFLAGMTVSNARDGNSLAPLNAGSRITLSVLAVGQSNPGADLTVLIRL